MDALITFITNGEFKDDLIEVVIRKPSESFLNQIITVTGKQFFSAYFTLPDGRGSVGGISAYPGIRKGVLSMLKVNSIIKNRKEAQLVFFSYGLASSYISQFKNVFSVKNIH